MADSPADPLGWAMLDFQRGAYDGGCVYRDGDDVADGRVREYYFSPPAEWSARHRRLVDSVPGPVADVGCGAGNHAVRFRRDREVVAVDVSPNAVRAARERGVERAAVMDMFDLGLRDGRFRTAWLWGTQVGLARSMARFRGLLADLDRVTTDDGRAVFNQYDPGAPGVEDRLGYRADPRPGFAWRTFHVEYARGASGGTERTRAVEREVGRTLVFLLFGPDRLREAVADTAWRVEAVRRPRGSLTYWAVLGKQ